MKKRFICHDCKLKFVEEVNINSRKSNISNSLKIKIRKDLLKYNQSINSIAKENGVSHTMVRRELERAMKNYPEHLRLLPSTIGFDEFKASTNKGKYAFILTDILHKEVLDILPSRRKDDLIKYFTFVENRRDVKYVISDMYEPYLIVQKVMFPNAKFVVDRFHYVRIILDALDKVRTRLQKEYGVKSKEYKMLKNKENISLLRKYSNDVSWYTYIKRYKNGRMLEVLKIEVRNQLLELNKELKTAYVLKELFLDTVRFSVFETAEEELLEWINVCEESNLEEFKTASKTIKNWLPYIVNSFIDKRYSNGFTEGVNNKIKVIKRIGYGYKNFKFFRLRIMYIMNKKLK